MQLNSLSTVGIATQVWVQATRTLTNPTGVWADAARTLTATPTVRSSLMSNAGSIAANTLLDLRPSANTVRQIVLMPSAAAFQYGTYDGTTFGAQITSLPTTTPTLVVIGAGTLGAAIKNNTAGALNFSYNGVDSV